MLPPSFVPVIVRDAVSFLNSNLAQGIVAVKPVKVCVALSEVGATVAILSKSVKRICLIPPTAFKSPQSTNNPESLPFYFIFKVIKLYY